MLKIPKFETISTKFMFKLSQKVDRLD
jgi:hypothetical protein